MNQRNQEWFNVITMSKGYLVELNEFPERIHESLAPALFETNIQAWIDLLNTIPFVTASRNTEADYNKNPIVVYAPISQCDILRIMNGDGLGKSRCKLALDDTAVWDFADQSNIDENTNITMYLGEYPSWQKFYKGLHHRLQNIFNSKVILILESLNPDARWEDFIEALTLSLSQKK